MSAVFETQYNNTPVALTIGDCFIQVNSIKLPCPVGVLLKYTRLADFIHSIGLLNPHVLYDYGLGLLTAVSILGNQLDMNKFVQLLSNSTTAGITIQIKTSYRQGCAKEQDKYSQTYTLSNCICTTFDTKISVGLGGIALINTPIVVKFTSMKIETNEKSTQQDIATMQQASINSHLLDIDRATS